MVLASSTNPANVCSVVVNPSLTDLTEVWLPFIAVLHDSSPAAVQSSIPHRTLTHTAGEPGHLGMMQQVGDNAVINLSVHSLDESAWGILRAASAADLTLLFSVVSL